MEGISGIVRPEQTSAGEALYEEGRKLYTQEINAAVRGAKAAGATEIVVMDCHGAGKGYSFNSLLAEDLDPDCEYVVQNEWTEYTAFGAGLPEPLVQRHGGRRDRDQRGALRHLGLSGVARDRRRCGLP